MERNLHSLTNLENEKLDNNKKSTKNFFNIHPPKILYIIWVYRKAYRLQTVVNSG